MLLDSSSTSLQIGNKEPIAKTVINVWLKISAAAGLAICLAACILQLFSFTAKLEPAFPVKLSQMLQVDGKNPKPSTALDSPLPFISLSLSKLCTRFEA